MDSARPSSLSFTSKVLSSVRDEPHYEEWSDAQLLSTLEEATRMHRTLTFENDVLEHYLLRKDPVCLYKLPMIAAAARKAQKFLHRQSLMQSAPRSRVGSQLGSQSSLRSTSRNKTMSATSIQSNPLSESTFGSQQLSTVSSGGISGGGGASKQSNRGPKLSIEHRIELADMEANDMKKTYDTFQKIITRKIMSLGMRFDELKHRIAECNEANEQFEEEVVSEDSSDGIKMTPEQKFTRFMEHQTKLVEAKVDQLNLKIVTTKRLISQTKKQIRVQLELGTVLRPIDFEQLAIENEYTIKETEWNTRFISSLKLIGGHYNRTAKNHKLKLLERKAQLQSIENDLVAKSHEKIDLQRTKMRVVREVKRAVARLNCIKELQENYETPGVMDFLDSQKQLQEAKKIFKNLTIQRKVQLFNLQAKTKKTRNSLFTYI